MRRGTTSFFRRGALAVPMVAILIVGAVTACGMEDRDGGSVTLNLLQLNNNKAGQEVVNANFERAHPGIKIETTYTDTTAKVAQQVLPALQAGSGPDVFLALTANGSPAGVWPLAGADRLLDLSDRPWAKDVPASLRAGSSADDALYGLPVAVTANGILYNAKLWDDLGLSAPTTLSELLSLCRKVDAAGKDMFAVSLAGGGISGSLPIAIILMNAHVYSADPEWTEKRNKGDVTFKNSSLWRGAYESLIAMRDAKCFNDSPEGTTGAEAEALIVTGKAVALLSSGSAMAPLQRTNPDLDFRIAPLPAAKAEHRVASAPSGGAMVANAATKHPEQTRAFLDFMAQPEQLGAWAEANNVISPYDAAKGTLPDYLADMKPLFDEGKVVNDAWTTLSNPRLLADVLAGYISGILSGEVSVDKLLTDADRMWDEPAN